MSPEILENYAKFELRWRSELEECTALLSGKDAFKSHILGLSPFKRGEVSFFKT